MTQFKIPRFVIVLFCLGLFLGGCQPLQPISTTASDAAGVPIEEALKSTSEVLFERTTELVSNQVHVKVRHVTFAVGYKTAEHTHAGPGARYVHKGEVEVSEAGEVQIFRAGEVFWETGAPMTAENVGDGEAEVIIVELLPVEGDNASTDAALQPTSPDVLFETIAELASNQVYVKVRHITLPVGYKTAEHTHAGPGPRYVLNGEVEISENGEVGPFQAGQIFWESGSLMTAENIDGSASEVIAFELLPPVAK